MKTELNIVFPTEPTTAKQWAEQVAPADVKNPVAEVEQALLTVGAPAAPLPSRAVVATETVFEFGAVLGPIFALTSTWNREDALRYSYNLPPMVQYWVMFVGFSFVSLMLLDSFKDRLSDRWWRQKTFVVFNLYAAFTASLTLILVHRPQTATQVMFTIPAVLAVALSVFGLLLAVFAPVNVELERERTHKRAAVWRTALLEGVDVSLVPQEIQELLISDRRAALEVLVSRGLLDANTAQRAASRPLTGKVSPGKDLP